VFHVELRQFPHAARAFNLTRAELDQRFVRPWVEGAPIEHEDRRWSPEKARLTIYEGPRLATEDMGMGRGWGNVTKSGQDVTGRLLSEAQGAVTATGEESERFKEEVLAGCAVKPQPLHALLLLANERYPQWRISERMAIAERAAWELLHQERVALVDAGRAVPRGQWQARILTWESWFGQDVVLTRLDGPAGG
jgi:hypothetical protein